MQNLKVNTKDMAFLSLQRQKQLEENMALLIRTAPQFELFLRFSSSGLLSIDATLRVNIGK